MKCLLFLHSTTGNTRLVARFAAEHLRRAGYECELVDITRHPEPPDLAEADLLGFACPTMYWRPTVVLERFVARMPNAGARPLPTFQLATAGGDPGAHFAIVAEILAHKGWPTLGAYFVPMVNNWPPHRALAEKIPLAERVAGAVAARAPSQRPTLSMLWPDVGEPEARHREGLEAFLDRVLALAAQGVLTSPKAPPDLWKGNRVMYAIGRLMTVEKMQQGTAIRIEADRCGRCGTCVKLCPSGTLTRAAEDEVPRVGATCTGCWTCHNHCPDKAISGFGAPAGAGRYHGPSETSRGLFE